MQNFNIRIALTKIPGAKVMDVKGEVSTRRCVVIPIDNEAGVVQDEYEAQNKDGSKTRKYLNDVQLNLTAYALKEPRYGHTHGVKVAYNIETLNRVREEDLRKTPFIGNLSPWFLKSGDDQGKW